MPEMPQFQLEYVSGNPVKFPFRYGYSSKHSERLFVRRS